MTFLAPLLLPVCITVALIWLALALMVIVTRAVHDRRRRGVREAQTRLREMIAGSVEADMGLLDDVLSGLPLAVIGEIAADSVTPKAQAEMLAAYMAHRVGAETLSRVARRGRKAKRIEALRILALARDDHALPLLDEALRDRDPDVVSAAVAALGGTGEEAAAVMLIDALRSRLYAPSRIATQLDRFSLPVSHLLAPLLDHPLAIVRFWGATLLARYSGDAGVNEQLSRLRDDPDPSVRKAAVKTLGRIGGPGAAETAVALIHDPVWFVRAHAARTLGDLRRLDFSPLLLPLLADREWWVRTAAKDALQAMGPDVAGQLVGSLTSEDAFARNGAAEVLQNLGVLDSLINEAAQSSQDDTEQVDLIGRILSAGGPELLRISVARADPAIAPAAVQLIHKAALKYGMAS